MSANRDGCLASKFRCGAANFREFLWKIVAARLYKLRTVTAIHPGHMSALNHILRSIKHVVGLGSILFAMDFYLLNGFCADACTQILSQASGQVLLELAPLRGPF